jgi:hypothetical protein
LTVIGTEVNSTRLKALSGTWPPVGKTLAEAIGAPNTALDPAVELALAAVLAEAEGARLDGPLATAALEDPPETTPVEPEG